MSPVCLKIEGRRRVVTSVEQAIFVLERRWPGDHSARTKALAVCRIALNGKAGAAAARDALVYAAIKAGIYIDLSFIGPEG